MNTPINFQNDLDRSQSAADAGLPIELHLSITRLGDDVTLYPVAVEGVVPSDAVVEATHTISYDEAVAAPVETVEEDLDAAPQSAVSLESLQRLAAKWPTRSDRKPAVLLTSTPTTVARAAKNKKATPALTDEVTQVHWRCPKDTLGHDLDPTTQVTFVYNGHTFESLLACEIFLRGKNLSAGVRESVKCLSQVMATRAYNTYSQNLLWNHGVAVEVGDAMWARVLGDVRMAEYLSTYRGRFSYHYPGQDGQRVIDREGSWRAEIMLRICNALMRRKQLIDSVDNMDDITDEQYDAMRAEIQTIKPNFEQVHTYRLPDAVYSHQRPNGRTQTGR